ncbi:hypothetical protein THOM_1090, partial [Trachipleistophora hominis]
VKEQNKKGSAMEKASTKEVEKGLQSHN